MVKIRIDKNWGEQARGKGRTEENSEGGIRVVHSLEIKNS